MSVNESIDDAKDMCQDHRKWKAVVSAYSADGKSAWGGCMYFLFQI